MKLPRMCKVVEILTKIWSNVSLNNIYRALILGTAWNIVLLQWQINVGKIICYVDLKK